MSDDNFHSLFLCKSARQMVTETEHTGIFVEDDDWDDNGYASMVNIYIKPNAGDKPWHVRAHMGDLTEDAPEKGIVARRIDEDKPYLLLGLDDNFLFTLLRSSASYRALIERFTLKNAKKILEALNDVVYLKHINYPRNMLDEIERTAVFKYAFIRHSSSWFAWHNAGSILNGIKNEQFDVISPVMNIRFQRENFATEHNITVRFNLEGLLPQRIAVIIGKNGIGKSQTLAEITDALLKNKANFSVDGEGGRVLVNRVLAFSATQDLSQPFPVDWSNPFDHAIDYRRFFLNKTVSDGLRNPVTDAIFELARGNQTLGQKSRWDMFREALKSIDNSHQIYLAMKSGTAPLPLDQLKKMSKPWPGKDILDIFDDISPTEIPFRYVNGKHYPLSSGEGCFLAFAAQVCRHIDNGTLVLIDEPETHLHPQFISQFADLLYNLLEMSGSVAIVATHSVYFVREVNHEQVIVLRQNDKNEVHVDVPILRTLGANVGAISRFVFGQDQQTRQIERIKNTLLEKYRDKGWEALEADYGDVLASELLSALRMAMENDQ